MLCKRLFPIVLLFASCTTVKLEQVSLEIEVPGEERGELVLLHGESQATIELSGEIAFPGEEELPQTLLEPSGTVEEAEILERENLLTLEADDHLLIDPEAPVIAIVKEEPEIKEVIPPVEKKPSVAVKKEPVKKSPPQEKKAVTEKNTTAEPPVAVVITESPAVEKPRTEEVRKKPVTSLFKKASSGESSADKMKTVKNSPKPSKPLMPALPLKEEVITEVHSFFKIEFDESEWLYSGKDRGVRFKNKFYLKDRVLFEFEALTPGNYKLLFKRFTGSSVEETHVLVIVSSGTTEEAEVKSVKEQKKEAVVIQKKLSKREELEKALKRGDEDQDRIYFELAEIYFRDGELKKAKEYYEYVWDNFPFSDYVEEAERQMNFIIDNYLTVR